MAIIISQNGKNAKRVERSLVEQEDYLQRYIYENPETLPLDEIGDEIHLLILAREFPTRSGPIDALGIDENGEIYVIETKLYKNPDKRQVVAQVLDYGASLWRGFGDANDFIARIEDFVRKNWSVSILEKLTNYWGCPEDEVVATLDNVKQNLRDGHLRFVVLMDQIHDQLKDLILFINQNSRFTLYGVEMAYFKHDQFEIMIPRLFGAEVKKEVGESASKRTRGTWDEETFFEDLVKRVADKPDCIRAVRKLYEFSREKSDDIGWGTGKQTGSFNPKFLHCCQRSLYTVYSNGTLIFNFQWLHGSESIATLSQNLARQLNEVDGIDVPDTSSLNFFQLSPDQWSPLVNELILVLEQLTRK